MRCEEVFDIPLGAAIGGLAGRKWLFVGWAKNTVGAEMMFVREITGLPIRPDSLWTYHVSMAETALRKFPALSDYSK